MLLIICIKTSSRIQKIIKIHQVHQKIYIQVHQKLQAKTIFIILLNMFSISITFEFEATRIFR